MKRIRPHSWVALAVLSQACHGNGQGEADKEHRRLSIESNIFNKAELFAHWTADKINNATPLDLKIDPRSGEGFIVKNDELVSYADMFAATEQRISGATLVKLSKFIDEEIVAEELDLMHVRTNRLGSKHKHGRALVGQPSTYDLASIKFKSSTLDYQNRILQTDADGFATLKKKPSKKDKKDKKNKKDKDKINNKNEGGRKKKKKFLPKIKSMNPSRGAKILSSHTFSAKVSPSATTQASIRDVQFRLVDPAGETSDWLPVPQGLYDDLYEITIEGFGAFPASKWKYQMSVYDEEGMSSTSPNVMFKVESTAGDELYDDLPSYEEYEDDDEEEEEDGNDSQGFEDTDLMEFDVVADSNWPYGGGIQSATGRILFEFNGSGTFVCSGTVVKDGEIKGRSIIFTAAHCAYNDSMKKFATKAVFIPDQVETKGSKSDFNCANDKYGCWELSFAVVSKGWAGKVDIHSTIARYFSNSFLH